MDLFHCRAGLRGGGSAEDKGSIPEAVFLSGGADVLQPMFTTFLSCISRSQVIYGLSEGLKMAYVRLTLAAKSHIFLALCMS